LLVSVSDFVWVENLLTFWLRFIANVFPYLYGCLFVDGCVELYLIVELTVVAIPSLYIAAGSTVYKMS
jgi:hypothetical protein